MPAPRQKETNNKLEQYEPVDAGWENGEKSEKNDHNEGWKHDEFTSQLVCDVADNNSNIMYVFSKTPR